MYHQLLDTWPVADTYLEQKADLTMVLQNVVLLSQCHMPVFFYAHTDTEDTLEAYLIPDTAVLMGVFCRFIFSTLM